MKAEIKRCKYTCDWCGNTEESDDIPMYWASVNVEGIRLGPVGSGGFRIVGQCGSRREEKHYCTYCCAMHGMHEEIGSLYPNHEEVR